MKIIEKPELKNALKKSRMVYDQLLEKRFVKKGENSGNAKVVVSDTQPTDTGVIWINTSKYSGV